MRVMYEGVLVPVLSYGSETTIWREKDRFRIKAFQMDNHRGLLGIRKMDRVPNVRIRELFGVAKGVDERIDESAFDGMVILKEWKTIGFRVCG